MTYTFNQNLYNFIVNHPEKVAWKDYKESRKHFPDYHCLANPIVKGSDDHLFWKGFFDNYFNANCTFPFIIRLINSFLITGLKQNET